MPVRRSSTVDDWAKKWVGSSCCHKRAADGDPSPIWVPGLREETARHQRNIVGEWFMPSTPGDIIGSGANQANYGKGAGYSVTQSGAYGSNQHDLTDGGTAIFLSSSTSRWRQ